MPPIVAAAKAAPPSKDSPAREVSLTIRWPSRTGRSTLTIPEDTNAITVRVAGRGTTQQKTILRTGTEATSQVAFSLFPGDYSVSVECLFRSAGQDRLLAQQLVDLTVSADQPVAMTIRPVLLPTPTPTLSPSATPVPTPTTVSTPTMALEPSPTLPSSPIPIQSVHPQLTPSPSASLGIAEPEANVSNIPASVPLADAPEGYTSLDYRLSNRVYGTLSHDGNFACLTNFYNTAYILQLANSKLFTYKIFKNQAGDLIEPSRLSRSIHEENNTFIIESMDEQYNHIGFSSVNTSSEIPKISRNELLSYAGAKEGACFIGQSGGIGIFDAENKEIILSDNSTKSIPFPFTPDMRGMSGLSVSSDLKFISYLTAQNRTPIKACILSSPTYTPIDIIAPYSNVALYSTKLGVHMYENGKIHCSIQSENRNIDVPTKPAFVTDDGEFAGFIENARYWPIVRVISLVNGSTILEARVDKPKQNISSFSANSDLSKLLFTFDTYEGIFGEFSGTTLRIIRKNQ